MQNANSVNYESGFQLKKKKERNKPNNDFKCYYREFSQISPAAMKSFGSVYTRNDFNFHCISLCHKHGYQFIVLGHQQIWLV